MRLVQAFSLLLFTFVLAAGAIPNARPRTPTTPKVIDRSVIDSLDTNAKRLAAGLPPLAARRLWSPTDSAKRWSTSPVPYKGKLGITAANGTFIGYVSRVLSRFGTYVADCEEKASTISFSASQSGKSPGLLLKDDTAEYPKVPYLGAIIAHGDGLATGNGWKRDPTSNNATIAGTGPTDPNQPPASGPNSGDPSGDNTPPGPDSFVSTKSNAYDVEAAIWTFDAGSKQMTTVFTNPDGASLNPKVYYNPCDPPGINLVTDVHTYLYANPDAFPITVNFIG